MFGLPVIEVAIGLVFAYVLLSILCTFVSEWFARLVKLRSRNLRRALKQLLADPDMNCLAKEVMDHHLIKGSSGPKGPSYIASETFARVLIDIIDKKSNGAAKAAKVRDDINGALDKAQLPVEVKAAIQGLIDNVDTSISELRENLQSWFDRSMERVSGWYKRYMQITSLVIAALLVLILNVDTIKISRTLWQNPVLRAQVADQAAMAVEACKGLEDPKNCSFLESTDKARAKLEEFPIGWPDSGGGNLGSWYGLKKIIGLLISVLAVSLGAPFWFDVLDKLNSIRSSGIRPKAKE